MTALSPVFVPEIDPVDGTVRVQPSAIVKVEPAAGCVIVTLLMLVAVATPNTGVVSVGDVAKTLGPLPVSSVSNNAKLADVGVVKKVAAPLASPEIPVVTGKPVQLVSVPADGVPMFGVINTGLVSTTNFDPVPVCELIDVTFPDERITPVKLALVVFIKSGPPIGITLVAAPYPSLPKP